MTLVAVVLVYLSIFLRKHLFDSAHLRPRF
jgi:hypothetical protein